MILKFEETGSLDVVLRNGHHATEPVIMEEVAIATAEATALSSNYC